MPHDPVVFISSTSDDLKDHRDEAAKAARHYGFSPRMMEYFPASGHAPSLAACREKVEEAEVVVVLVAHRYGWVPDSPENPDKKSITWLECEHAWTVTGNEVLAFVVDPDYTWRLDWRENYRLITESNKRGIKGEVRRNEKSLAKFKQELNRYVRSTFTDAASVRTVVSEALADWRRRHDSATLSTAPQDPEPYLKALEDDTRQIRITGLATKRAEPYFFGIDEIYIPLTTLAVQDQHREMHEQRRIALEQALSAGNAVIIGGPGSGKSTFLRRVAFELCCTLRGTRPDGAPPFLAPDDNRFPILIRVASLASLLEKDTSPKEPDSPAWLPYLLGRQSEQYSWGVNEAFFRRKLSEGLCLVMVDGLDEAPERRMRERIARLFERATRAFQKCDFLVSTRPQTNVGDSVLARFHPVRIGDLEPPEIEAFFDHFARGLALNDVESKAFKEGLQTAFDTRPEIREMAANPVMLTALAVLQHNDQRLPEYRVELYESILGWLAAAREAKGGRPAKKCLEYMRKLALRMQDALGGRTVQVSKRSAAELSAEEFGGSVEANEELLEQETHDSGIVVSAGSELKFRHLSFQEYLAARELGNLTDKQQIERVVKSGRLYDPEWRETMRLLGGVLRQKGEAKVEGLFEAIMEQLGKRPVLVKQARCAALLGVMMRDLSRMGYTPKTPEYAKTIKAGMAIFDLAGADQLDIKTRIEAADALGQVGDPRLEQDNWIRIPAGTFWMGAQKKDSNGRNYHPEAYEDESPVHTANLRRYKIGRFPVTVQEFGRFMTAKGYSLRQHWREGFSRFKQPEDWERQRQYPNRPVVGVSWYEAAAYCSWVGGRLPTEEEWERAARGPESCQYPWGTHPPLEPSRANYEHDNMVGHPTPVGLFPKGNSGEGVCDLLGNVWEWCEDWYVPSYEKPARSNESERRVVRGGAWYGSSQFVRVSFRYGSEPGSRGASIGFRCARD